jgi:hypothetical protein
MLSHFAAPRLATLQTFFKTTSNNDLLGCYAWNQAVAAGLFPVLVDIEVAIRNSLHVALSQHYGGVDSFNWMLPVPNPAHAVNPAAPSTLPSRHSLSSTTRRELVSLANTVQMRKGPSHIVTPDDIIAGLHFGFWEQLIKGLAHASHPAGLQASILSVVFPHAPVTAAIPHGHATFRNQVANLLKRIRDVRNRVGHHDALWQTPEFDLSGNIGFVPRRPRHTVSSLLQFCTRLHQVAGWIDPEIQRHLHTSDHWASLQALLSREALAAYRVHGGKVGAYQAVIQTSLGQALLPLSKRPRRFGQIHAGVVFRRIHY